MLGKEDVGHWSQMQGSYGPCLTERLESLDPNKPGDVDRELSPIREERSWGPGLMGCWDNCKEMRSWACCKAQMGGLRPFLLFFLLLFYFSLAHMFIISSKILFLTK